MADRNCHSLTATSGRATPFLERATLHHCAFNASDYMGTVTVSASVELWNGL